MSTESLLESREQCYIKAINNNNNSIPCSCCSCGGWRKIRKRSWYFSSAIVKIKMQCDIVYCDVWHPFIHELNLSAEINKVILKVVAATVVVALVVHEKLDFNCCCFLLYVFDLFLIKLRGCALFSVQLCSTYSSIPEAVAGMAAQEKRFQVYKVDDIVAREIKQLMGKTWKYGVVGVGKNARNLTHTNIEVIFVHFKMRDLASFCKHISRTS